MQEPTRRRELRTYFAHLRRWLWFLVLATLIGASGAFVVAKLQPKTYLATTLLQVDTLSATQDPYSNVLASNQLVTTYVALATQPDVLKQAADQVGGISVQQLTTQVHVAALTGTQLLEIQVEDVSPTRAADLANAISAAFITKHQASVLAELTQTQQQIATELGNENTQIAQLNAQIVKLRKSNPNDPTLASLQQQLTDATNAHTSLQNVQGQIAAQSLVGENNIHVFQAANPPASPDHPKPLLYGAAGAALGLAFATLLILLRGFTDDRVRDGRDVDELTGLPTIGTVKSLGNSHVMKADETSHFAESFQFLRTNLEFAAIDRPIKTIVVAGAYPDEGKTMIATNLAISFAQDGKRVMLIDADLRHGGLAKLLGLQNASGLSQCLANNAPAADMMDAYQTLPKIPNLSVLTAGQRPQNPGELLGGNHLQSFLNSLLGKNQQPGLVDLVILISPSLLDIADLQVLAAAADTTILTVDAAQTSEDQLLRAYVLLQRIKAQIAGVVLNHAQPPREDVVAAYLKRRAIESLGIAAGSKRAAPVFGYERNN